MKDIHEPHGANRELLGAPTAESLLIEDTGQFTGMKHNCAPSQWLAKWERYGLFLLLLVALGFGVIVEMRSAFQKTRKTDFAVYLRAAWAVRAGEDLYTVTDEHGWHYHYPPLFAILMVPLAEPPLGADRPGTVPFPVTVALWYVFNLVCLGAAVHGLASALERLSTEPSVRDQPAGCRRWWTLRVCSVLVCLPPIGHTLSRGQVNLVVLFLLCRMVVDVLDGRSGRAGMWLAGAICLKIIPAYLLLYPLLRRDWRFLASCALGLAVGLALIPGLVFGTSRTIHFYQEIGEGVLLPALSEKGDRSRADEQTTSITAADNHSFQAVIHRTMYSDRSSRPEHQTLGVRVVHWLASGLVTVVMLLAAGRESSLGATQRVVLLGAFMAILPVISPNGQQHYFILSLPLVMGLMWSAWEQLGPTESRIGIRFVFTANILATALSLVPGLDLLRDLGLPMYATLLLWFKGIHSLCARFRESLSLQNA